MPEDVFSSGSKPLDRDASAPLWRQLEAELRRRLDEGDFDDRFPTDRELMEVYGVSRHTARHAISQLGADGMVRRARGIGTSLDQRTLARSLGALYSLRQLIEATGSTQHTKVLTLEVVTDAVACSHLGVASDTELVFLERLRYADGLTIAIDRVWIPVARAAPLLDVDFSDASLYETFERVLGRRPNDGVEQITAATASNGDRRLLELDDPSVFLFERLGRCDGEPFEWRTTVVPSARFALVAEWSSGQRSDLQVQLTALVRLAGATPPT